VGRGACLVTGGAGFIGCAISPGLIHRFDHVVALDALHCQVHPARVRPDALAKGVELVIGDVAEPNTWRRLLAQFRPTTILHLAAETGTGQSLTESSRHTHVNVTGTAVMLDALSQAKCMPDQILLTSSRAIYGEGPWRSRLDGSLVYPGLRSRDQLASGSWDFQDLQSASSDGAWTVPNPVSVYGATKLAQEHILRAWAAAFGVGLTILRLQNVYGPGQSLSNPYTGIVSLFCQIARQGESIPLYEDGLMLRDFVVIDDVATAILNAIDRRIAVSHALDVGTGKPATLAEIAHAIVKRYGAPPPYVCGKYRFGDVRHAACNVQTTQALLGWNAVHNLDSGLDALTSWIDAQLPPKRG
jgi:dTDP-L-rhamnose 4-epimerase